MRVSRSIGIYDFPKIIANGLIVRIASNVTRNLLLGGFPVCRLDYYQLLTVNDRSLKFKGNKKFYTYTWNKVIVVVTTIWYLVSHLSYTHQGLFHDVTRSWLEIRDCLTTMTYRYSLRQARIKSATMSLCSHWKWPFNNYFTVETLSY